MIGIETTQGAIGDALRKSYDGYAIAAQFRNAVIREQLQAMQEFVAISDKLLRLPFPGLMSADRDNDTCKDLAVQMQNVFSEHSSSTLELWTSMFGYQGAASDNPATPKSSGQKKAVTQAASKSPKTSGRKPAKANGGKQPSKGSPASRA